MTDRTGDDHEVFVSDLVCSGPPGTDMAVSCAATLPRQDPGSSRIPCRPLEGVLV
ncbi:hypothetical protein [Rhodococcus tibetensis]|uniref:Uncharacterized protein n=1 Tax=Rhodococcus tibetensis TaxID=2965064 RepID=A0ABT1QFW5_9NOCA|nr:hypothetical protein [Rhodococcus sp. FXJ9.536]MCQ4119997.1 hypothetical protein [Rhodococcus sp. FXJ9.536]